MLKSQYSATTVIHPLCSDTFSHGLLHGKSMQLSISTESNMALNQKMCREYTNFSSSFFCVFFPLKVGNQRSKYLQIIILHSLLQWGP